MKVLVLLFAIAGFTAKSAISKIGNSETSILVKSDKYKACIDACNKCISCCKVVEKKCGNDPKMAEMKKACKECVASCKKAITAMKADKNVKAECGACAKACKKCAEECDKFDMAECKKCAKECRTCEKLCSEMK